MFRAPRATEGKYVARPGRVRVCGGGGERGKERGRLSLLFFLWQRATRGGPRLRRPLPFTLSLSLARRAPRPCQTTRTTSSPPPPLPLPPTRACSQPPGRPTAPSLSPAAPSCARGAAPAASLPLAPTRAAQPRPCPRRRRLRVCACVARPVILEKRAWRMRLGDGKGMGRGWEGAGAEHTKHLSIDLSSSNPLSSSFHFQAPSRAPSPSRPPPTRPSAGTRPSSTPSTAWRCGTRIGGLRTRTRRRRRRGLTPRTR